MSRTLVELCAGAAAVSLRAIGGSKLAPPTAWMGGKRKLADDILGALGVEQLGRIVLVDAGPWGAAWPMLLDPEQGALVSLYLRAWENDFDADRGRGPRELWEHLSSIPPYEIPSKRIAQWLWLQARSASGVPVWWGPDLDETGWRMGEEPSKSKRSTRAISQGGGAHEWRMGSGHHEGGDTNAGQKGGAWRMGSSPERSSTTSEQPAAQAGQWLASDGRGVTRAAGQKGDHRDGPIGEWQQAAGGDDSRADLKAHQRGDDWKSQPKSKDPPSSAAQASGVPAWKRSRSGRGGRLERTADQTYDSRWPHGGIVRPSTIANRIDAIRAAVIRWGGRVDVVHQDVRTVQPWPVDAVYFDPPYVGATGYGWSIPRADVVDLAARWAEWARVVAVSEACALEELVGWHPLALRYEPKPEWLTLSEPPARLPIRQVQLWGAA